MYNKFSPTMTRGIKLEKCIANTKIKIGMSSAMDTLCGQAYGAEQFGMLGVHMQRAMLVLTLVSIPVAFAWAFTRQILIGLHQDREIAAEAGLYARFMIPSLFGFAFLQCCNKFLQMQNIVLPLLLSSCFVAVLHILVCWLLVFRLGLGTRGAAITISISYWVNVLVLALYVKLSSACKTTWTGFSRKALHDVCNFIKLAVPSAIMICLEYWAIEVLVILSGLLPNPKLATSVMSIILSSIGLVSTITLGMGAAASTRVSNELGAGNPQVARIAVFVALSIILVEGVTAGVILVCIRNVWGYAYSNERNVAKQIAALVPFVAITHLIDGCTAVLQGTARGCGWQKICVFINIASYYIVGIPISVLSAFVFHIGTKGLLVGLTCACFVQTSILAIITLRSNWDVEAMEARERVNKSIIPTRSM